jgi:hypothetical protein
MLLDIGHIVVGVWLLLLAARAVVSAVDGLCSSDFDALLWGIIVMLML